MRHAGGVQPDFGGTTAPLYAKYRRDLPAFQAAALAQQIELRPEDVVVDLVPVALVTGHDFPSEITQGPPMWLGAAPWQVAVRKSLEASSGPVVGNCCTDESALDERLAIARRLDLEVQMLSWQADHVVDIDWVIGHLGSAMNTDRWTAVKADLTRTLQAFDGQPMIEQVSTTALILRGRSLNYCVL